MDSFLNKKLVVMLAFFLVVASSLAAPAFKFDSEFQKTFGVNPDVLKKESAVIVKENAAFKDTIITDQILALYAYTAGASTVLNASLRSSDQKKKTAVSSFAELLKSSLAKLPDYKGETFRGTHLPSEILKQYKVGSIVSDPAFLSTSLVGNFPGPHRMKIRSKSGKIISPFSSRPKENEVLFAPLTRFKVTEVKEEAGSVLVFTLEEI